MGIDLEVEVEGKLYLGSYDFDEEMVTVYFEEHLNWVLERGIKHIIEICKKENYPTLDWMKGGAEGFYFWGVRNGRKRSIAADYDQLRPIMNDYLLM